MLINIVFTCIPCMGCNYQSFLRLKDGKVLDNVGQGCWQRNCGGIELSSLNCLILVSRELASLYNWLVWSGSGQGLSSDVKTNKATQLEFLQWQPPAWTRKINCGGGGMQANTDTAHASAFSSKIFPPKWGDVRVQSTNNFITHLY